MDNCVASGGWELEQPEASKWRQIRPAERGCTYTQSADAAYSPPDAAPTLSNDAEAGYRSHTRGRDREAHLDTLGQGDIDSQRIAVSASQ